LIPITRENDAGINILFNRTQFEAPFTLHDVLFNQALHLQFSITGVDKPVQFALRWSGTPPSVRMGRKIANDTVQLLGVDATQEAWNLWTEGRACYKAPNGCIFYSSMVGTTTPTTTYVGTKEVVTSDDNFWCVFGKGVENYRHQTAVQTDVGRKCFQLTHILMGTVGLHVHGYDRPPQETDLSHLCHHGGCLSIGHLTFEHTVVNTRERSRCFAAGVCSHHFDPVSKEELEDCIILESGIKTTRKRKRTKVSKDEDEEEVQQSLQEFPNEESQIPDDIPDLNMDFDNNVVDLTKNTQ